MKRPRRREGPVGLARAVDHPIRRRALRRLNAGETCSSVEIAQELGLPLSSITYHLRVLQLYGAAKVVQGSPSSTVARYESTVADDRWVFARLAATEAEDEAAVHRLVDKRLRKAI